ncbi:response regulator [Pseudomonas sp. NPDC087612]|uniref:response regulator transcription factor n=1 Tax=unclassified Pseudomonas TaxID=196821 RepID=UPI0008834C23|nr:MULTISPECIES: response regulator transcription factor [unclassified Pseudomonas]QPG62005.1 response regulator transcription factor [Pseudomonas sp. BIGb0427]QVM94231.1 response regulator transcription factor [Pseudomonas sp. SORT22]UVL53886.1 response regulator transcription factor [Pseudomonas sp. B21-035]UVL59144.1 response regulator transcription factor [Pseudomonas sp. B21-032]UVM64360.1 response regulator transcription factor [Pseudomonas sp. B21-009]
MAILLVDDHPMLRLGLVAALQQGLEGMTVIEAASGEEALAKVGEQLPGLVIMDVDLPGISGVETTRRLRQRLPQLRVLFFSEHTDLGLVRQAMAAGACGYLSKAAEPAVLLEAVRRVLCGHAYIEQALATELVCQPGDTGIHGLTQRETEIFLMLAKGTPTRLIAEQLCISSKTVSNYLTLLKSKLQVASQAQMVRLAIEAGLLRVVA